MPVGEDQVQHLELSRVDRAALERALRPMRVFRGAQPLLTPTRRIMGLDGQAKMSKSMGNTIGLLEAPDEVWAKLRPAVTDPKRVKRDRSGDARSLQHLSPAQGVQPARDSGARRGAVPHGGVGLHRLQEGAPRVDGAELVSDPRAGGGVARTCRQRIDDALEAGGTRAQ